MCCRLLYLEFYISLALYRSPILQARFGSKVFADSITPLSRSVIDKQLKLRVVKLPNGPELGDGRKELRMPVVFKSKVAPRD